MTNFQGQRSTSPLRLLTPERALFLLPVLINVGFAVAILLLLVAPMWQSTRERKELVEGLLLKSVELPELKRDLAQQQRLRNQVREQESRLLHLLAGTKDLGTFLSEMNELAVRHSVIVSRAEPGEIERWNPPLEGQDAMQADLQQQTGEMPIMVDPLIQEGLLKRSASITINGSFNHVRAFLQDLEGLEVFVITSDLEIEAVRGYQESDADREKVETNLRLELSVYGREPSESSDNEINTLNQGVQS